MSKVYEVVKNAERERKARARTTGPETLQVAAEETRSPAIDGNGRGRERAGQAQHSSGLRKAGLNGRGLKIADRAQRLLSRPGELLKIVKKTGAKQAAPRRETVIPPDAACSDEDRQKAGWVSHEYTQSRKVELDVNLCLENRCVALLSGAREMDYYRVLRTHILHNTANGSGNTIMITSALPGEGKTVTAVNLALALAKDFHRTALLVDCDLRRQSVHEVLGIRSEKGLIDYLLNDATVSELIMWPGIDKLTIISGGRAFPESAELLGSRKMKQLVQDMKDRYSDRYVIFDAPPILAGADALALTPLVDHVLVVVQADKTPMADVRKALGLIPEEKILGLVLNRVKNLPDASYSRYGGHTAG